MLMQAGTAHHAVGGAECARHRALQGLDRIPQMVRQTVVATPFKVERPKLSSQERSPRTYFKWLFSQPTGNQRDGLLGPAGVNPVDEIDVADPNCQVWGANTEVVLWEE